MRVERVLGKDILGDTFFKSDNVLSRDTPHYRDDLISCCYVLRTMTDKPLPWSGLNVSDEKKMITMKRNLLGAALFGQHDLWESQKRDVIPDCSALISLFDLVKNLKWGDELDFQLWII